MGQKLERQWIGLLSCLALSLLLCLSAVSQEQKLDDRFQELVCDSGGPSLSPTLQSRFEALVFVDTLPDGETTEAAAYQAEVTALSQMLDTYSDYCLLKKAWEQGQECIDRLAERKLPKSCLGLALQPIGLQNAGIPPFELSADFPPPGARLGREVGPLASCPVANPPDLADDQDRFEKFINSGMMTAGPKIPAGALPVIMKPGSPPPVLPAFFGDPVKEYAACAADYKSRLTEQSLAGRVQQMRDALGTFRAEAIKRLNLRIAMLCETYPDLCSE